MHPSVPPYKFRQFTYRGDHQEPAIEKKKRKKDETFSGNKERKYDCVSVCVK